MVDPWESEWEKIFNLVTIRWPNPHSPTSLHLSNLRCGEDSSGHSKVMSACFTSIRHGDLVKKVGQSTAFLFARHLSLNSAIHKGIRRGGRTRTADPKSYGAKYPKTRGDDEYHQRRPEPAPRFQADPKSRASSFPKRLNERGIRQRRSEPFTGLDAKPSPNASKFLKRRDDGGSRQRRWEPSTGRDTNSKSHDSRFPKRRDDDTFRQRRSEPSTGRDTNTEFHNSRFSKRRDDDKFRQRTSEPSTRSDADTDSGRYSPDESPDPAVFSKRRAINPPSIVPYTTAASHFLYGTSVVEAALRSGKRKLYKLYVHEGANRTALARDASLRKLALSKGVEVVGVQGDWLRIMDKMSEGRPHNGYVLEASATPKLPVSRLEAVSSRQSGIQVDLDHQSKEDEAVNGTETTISRRGRENRFPFILMLDGLVDPGNVGAIIRSAYFLGVDAIAISNRQSAPLSSVAVKASSGAIEHLPILSLAQPVSFVDESKREGWKFYAAVAPPGHHDTFSGPSPIAATPSKNYLAATAVSKALDQYPCVLMLGAEGDGLRRELRRKAHYEVGVEGAGAGHAGVDSLNVSVAAALLTHAFLQPAARPLYRLQPEPDRERLF
ncbi:MAG: hypothetical protein M1833_005138 [Piccolia ochrophora]|nr:MAG: hypothetical protein M1833_005138 [Piccolia ochrophora]